MDEREAAAHETNEFNAVSCMCVCARVRMRWPPPRIAFERMSKGELKEMKWQCMCSQRVTCKNNRQVLVQHANVWISDSNVQYSNIHSMDRMFCLLLELCRMCAHHGIRELFCFALTAPNFLDPVPSPVLGVE